MLVSFFFCCTFLYVKRKEERERKGERTRGLSKPRKRSQAKAASTPNPPASSFFLLLVFQLIFFFPIPFSSWRFFFFSQCSNFISPSSGKKYFKPSFPGCSTEHGSNKAKQIKRTTSFHRPTPVSTEVQSEASNWWGTAVFLFCLIYLVPSAPSSSFVFLNTLLAKKANKKYWNIYL